jgi:hypothetical protein
VLAESSNVLAVPRKYDMVNKVVIPMHLIGWFFNRMKAAMRIPTIVIAIYVAVFVATTALTILNYKPDPVGNIPLTILAHIFWPITFLTVFIWLFVDSRRNELHED